MMDEKMTTAEFHRLLEENTRKHAAERSRHQEVLSKLSNDYHAHLDEILELEQRDLDRYREARIAWEDARQTFNYRKHERSKSRNQVGQALNEGKAEEANRWTLANNQIQNERHNIFERYRLSGGVLTGDASEMLHPSWTKREKGVSDDENN